MFIGGRTAADSIEPLIAAVTGATKATGYWALSDRLEFPDEISHGYGHYRENYVKADDRWIFSSLALTRVACAWEARDAAGVGV